MQSLCILVLVEQPSLTDFTILFAFATSGMLILAGGIVFFVLFYKKRMLEAKIREQNMEVAYQQKMLQAALESQENERKRLAADLHDSIGSMLSTIRLSLSTSASTDQNFKENVVQIKIMLDDTIESVRKLSRDLLPSTLEKFGLSNAVKELCEQYSAVSGLPITFHESGESKPLDKPHEVMVFRIVQELISNAMKHAKATQIQTSLDWRDTLEVCVADDGIGFTPDSKSSGLGLFNMQNRAKLLQAAFRFEPNEPKGTKGILALPNTA